ncbi:MULTISPECIES: hypothetical protein [unclassified Streptomyces]|uniref:hypothetical protein n=1 Tax=unclassified Streptomyces TaxID=2593676 RepID=UPI002E12E135|nr:hypothetical protein OIE63_37530 [Streptomyces sp. NBC_01795]WSB81039.1 hypothetical protein OHB04_38640 [Streptomyces sp. NBC_01775]WSS10750.1 hypothetical protein OG533_01615 [Streptomyces sp. NBC_01186]WSS39447.1 hypothetical protein OG220_01650 [Streptomyces sp. NBC_01187]
METTALDGATIITVYERGLARLILHEVEHPTACCTSPGCGPASDRSRWWSTGRPPPPPAPPGHTSSNADWRSAGSIQVSSKFSYRCRHRLPSRHPRRWTCWVAASREAGAWVRPSRGS